MKKKVLFISIVVSIVICVRVVIMVTAYPRELNKDIFEILNENADWDCTTYADSCIYFGDDFRIVKENMRTDFGMISRNVDSINQAIGYDYFSGDITIREHLSLEDKECRITLLNRISCEEVEGQKFKGSESKYVKEMIEVIDSTLDPYKK